MNGTAVTLTTLRPELSPCGTLLYLRFEPPAGQRGPWYRVAVTATLASQIRQLATERAYDKLDADAQRALRREIADELGTKIQNVVKALVQTGRGGRKRTIEHRCPACEQALMTHTAAEALARFLAKQGKAKNRE